MAAVKDKEYLVVVEPPRPKPPQVQQGGFVSGQTWSMTPGATVRRVKAKSPEAAAEAAGVTPGCRAYVALIEHVSTFTRPEKAPLVAA